MTTRTVLPLAVLIAASLVASNASAESEAHPLDAPESPTDESSGSQSDRTVIDEVQIVYDGLDAPIESLGTVRTLDNRGATAGGGAADVARVLERAPSVHVREEDGFGLRPNIGLRGVDSDRSSKVTLMEDGVLFGPAPYSAPAAYYFPLMLRVARVEVTTGAAALRYGPSSVGGAIDLLGRSIPTGMAGEASGMFGSDMTGRLHLFQGGSNARGGYALELAHLRSDGFRDLDTGGNTGFTRWDGTVTGELRLGAASAHTLRLKVGGGFERSNETYLGLTDADFADTPNRRYISSDRDRMEWERAALRLDHEVTTSGGIRFVSTAYRHVMDRSWRRLDGFRSGPSIADVLSDPTTPRNRVFFDVLTGDEDSIDAETLAVAINDRSFVSQGLQSSASWQTDGEDVGHSVQIGARLHADRIDRRHDVAEYAVVAGEMERDGTPERATTRNRGATTAAAAYSVYELRFKRLRVSPIVRGEVIDAVLLDRLDDSESRRLYAVFLPGLGASFDLTRDLQAFAGVHRGFSPMSPGAPDDARPEASVNSEAGLRYRTAIAELEVTAFLNEYARFLADCTASSGCLRDALDARANAGALRIAGAEALMSLRPHLTSGITLPIDATYALTHSRFLADASTAIPRFDTISEGDALPYVPVHRASLRLGVERPASWRGHIRGAYSSPMREQAGSEPLSDVEATDPQLRLDAELGATVLPGLELFVVGENLTGAQPLIARRPFGARSIRPLGVFGGASYRW